MGADVPEREVTPDRVLMDMHRRFMHSTGRELKLARCTWAFREWVVDWMLAQGPMKYDPWAGSALLKDEIMVCGVVLMPVLEEDGCVVVAEGRLQ